MKKITPKEFLLRQPAYPEVSETDPYYLSLANRLLEESAAQPFVSEIPEALHRRVVLALTDYMQDIVADAGLWRSFVDANRELYGWSVPFHEIGEGYVDYELNREDVRFLVWYVVAMLNEEMRTIYPHDASLIAYADRCFAILESEYDDAPVPEHYNIARGLEFNDAADHKAIYELGNWLFLHSYLLTPAFAMSLQEIMGSVDPADPDAAKTVNERLEEAMMENTTGPLALFTPEWVYLMLERKLPKQPAEESPAKEPHPYYSRFVEYTGGETVKFFASYEEMNRFFIEALGWEKGEEHLAQAKGADDYILMVTRDKGMLMARDIARCVKAPQNSLYNEEYASNHAFDLLCDRGLCPGDLLRRIFSENWLPDAKFPSVRTGTENSAPGIDDESNRHLVHSHRDFIARLYLQIYYRGD